MADLGNFDYSPQSDLTGRIFQSNWVYFLVLSALFVRKTVLVESIIDYEFIIRELHLKYSSDEHHNVFGGILVATRLDRSV